MCLALQNSNIIICTLKSCKALSGEDRAVDISMTSDIPPVSSPHFPATDSQFFHDHFNKAKRINLGRKKAKSSIAMSPATAYPVLSRDETLSQLPSEYPDNAQSQIARILTTTSPSRLVVLDDDPTGTQTSHDISVLTVWDLPTLIAEFDELSSPGFFILTNSRALPPIEAEQLIREVCHNVALAAKATRQSVDVVLRSDSTLRGHFPLEVDIAQETFGGVDAWILAPFFYQGGRFTINDVHYVAEGDRLVPAGLTQFARDATFGYSSSNLKDYVMEKAPGRFTPEQLYSVSIDEIRNGGPDGVCEKLVSLPRGGVVIVNAAAESDMHVFVAGLLLGLFPLCFSYSSD